MATHTLDSMTKTTGGTRLFLDRYLDQMHQTGHPDLQPLLRALTDTDRLSYRQIVDWLNDNGWPISDNAVYEYRRKRRVVDWCDRTGVQIEPRP